MVTARIAAMITQSTTNDIAFIITVIDKDDNQEDGTDSGGEDKKDGEEIKEQDT